MSIDDRSLRGLIEESEDLQSDALRDARAAIPDLQDLRSDRRGERPEPDQLRAFNASRRSLLTKLGVGGGGLAARGLLAGTFGTAFTAILARPAAADEALDIQMLNTASALENLAVATYDAALGLDFIKNGNKTIIAFAETTKKQHAEHGEAFNNQAVALGGKKQTAPHPDFLKVVEQTKPTLKSPLDVVKLAASLEEVASDTYLSNLTQFADSRSKEIMGSVLGVEVQHLTILKAVEALLGAGAEELVAVPTNLPKLPAVAGSVGFLDGAFLTLNEGRTLLKETVAEPKSGAVK